MANTTHNAPELTELVTRLKLLLKDLQRLNAEGKTTQIRDLLLGSITLLEQKGF